MKGDSSGPPESALVVANPISGRGRGLKAAEELTSGLCSRGVEAELYFTGARGDAFAHLRALERDYEAVVAVGGDGTLREVLEGLVDPEVPVGILPFGTANVLAHELGIPRSVHRMLEIVMRGRRAGLDVTRVNGSLSFLVTGVGIDAWAVSEVESRRTGPITKWSYVGATLRALRSYRAPRMRVALDGEELPGEFGFVFVSNTARYGGVLRLDPDARIDDGRLEVYLFPTGTRLELFRACVRGLVHHLPGGPVQMRHARSIRVESEGRVPYEVDGDLGGHTPVEIELAPSRYSLIVP